VAAEIAAGLRGAMSPQAQTRSKLRAEVAKLGARLDALRNNVSAVKSVTSPIAKPRKTTKLPKYVRRQVAAARRKKNSVNKPKENPVVSKQSKAQKAAAKSIRKSLAKPLATQRARTVVAKSVPNLRAQLNRKIATLETSIKKSAASNNPQEGWAVAFQLNRAYADLVAVDAFAAKAATPSPDSFSSYEAYMSDPNANARAAAEASRAATQRAVGSAQGDAINHHLGRQSPRDQIRDILDDSGQPCSLQTFEVQTQRLEKQLRDATNVQDRESLGYQVTRRKLLAMHARGEG
jgi:hypothetical protein